jgi:hypothetical protein
MQRISTVLSFFNELKDENGKSYPKNGLILNECSLLKSLKGVTIDTLPLEFKLQIKRTPCRIEIILKESDFKMRYELFKRLNTGGEGLSRQEIRNCIFRGLDNRYNDFVLDLSKNENFRRLVYISEVNEEKMYYEELLLRFLALKNWGTQYKQSNIQDYLDDYLKEQCENYNDEEVVRDRIIFEKIMEFLKDLIGNDIFMLGKRFFTTSMYDAILLTLAKHNNFEEISKEEFIDKINNLKKDIEFNRYVGSASSNPTSITNKVRIANKFLFGISEE